MIEHLQRETERHRRSEDGSALIVLLISMVAVGALMMAHLTHVVAENNKVRSMVHAERAQQVAIGELEYAKNVVNAAAYRGGHNTAISAALGATPPLIPGTQVEVVDVPGAPSWVMMRARGSYQGIERSAQIYCRERSPMSSYNFFVVDHPLGISGRPRGPIHSNKTVDFYFPNGEYVDSVTASEGFEFRAGATEANTGLRGPTNDSAPRQNPLADIDPGALADKADTLRVDDDLIARITLDGDQVNVKLSRPPYTVDVEKTGTRTVVTGYETTYSAYRVVTSTVDRVEDILEPYPESYVDREPVYAYRDVEREVERTIWVESPPPDPDSVDGGASVGGGTGSYGYWKTITETVTERERYVVSYNEVTKTRTAYRKIGERTVTDTVTDRTLIGEYPSRDAAPTGPGIEIVANNKPIEAEEEYTYTETVTVPEEYVETKTVPADGTIYIAREIRSIQGTLNGKLTLITGGKARITDSIRYVDSAGNTRMSNGLDATKPYVENPDYKGQSVLALIAARDIRYAANGPTNLEVNASLISMNGTVSFEGISISSDGKKVSSHKTGGTRVKESLRRLGGVVSRNRPVASYVDDSNRTQAGFERGSSIMDRNLIIDGNGGISPPFMFDQNKPIWALGCPGRKLDTK